MDEIITMSKKEISCLEIMQKIEQKTLKQSEAAKPDGDQYPTGQKDLPELSRKRSNWDPIEKKRKTKQQPIG